MRVDWDNIVKITDNFKDKDIEEIGDCAEQQAPDKYYSLIDRLCDQCSFKKSAYEEAQKFYST